MAAGILTITKTLPWTSSMNKFKATVVAPKNLLAIKDAQTKAVEMKAASKIILDEDEYLDIQAAALQSYHNSLDAQNVNMVAKAVANFDWHTLATGIVDSGDRVMALICIFIITPNKSSNATKHSSQVRTANGQSRYTTHAGKTKKWL